MATIDIRDVEDTEINIIKFSDKTNGEDACYLKRGSFVSIDTELSENCIFIDTETDAKNLIKALEKAIKLGWWK
jgi:hypothetical protein